MWVRGCFFGWRTYSVSRVLVSADLYCLEQSVISSGMIVNEMLKLLTGKGCFLIGSHKLWVAYRRILKETVSDISKTIIKSLSVLNTKKEAETMLQVDSVLQKRKNVLVIYEKTRIRQQNA